MTNINPLLSNCYNMVLGRGDKKLVLFGQNVSVPGIRLATQPQPTTLGTQIPVAVNSFTFDALELAFIVDENIENWKSIYDWMRAIGNIENDTENTPYHEWASYSILTILQSSYLRTTIDFQFMCLVPVALSALNFRSDISDTNPVTAKVVFQYSHYNIV